VSTVRSDEAYGDVRDATAVASSASGCRLLTEMLLGASVSKGYVRPPCTWLQTSSLSALFNCIFDLDLARFESTRHLLQQRKPHS